MKGGIMMWEETPHTILVIMTAATLVLSAFYIWRRSHVPGVKAATLLMLLGATYMVAYAVEIASSTLPIKVLGDKMQFVAVSIMPLGWLIYVFQFCGREKWMTYRTIVVLSSVPVLLILLALTNESHSIIWSRVAVDRNGALELDKLYNTGYWIFVIYSYIVMPFGSVLLIRTFLRRRLLHQQQGKTLLFAVFLPLVGSIVYLIGAIPSVHPSSTLFFPIVVTLIMAYFFVGWRMVDIVPTAWGAVVHSIHDSVIVVDNQNCIMDLNPAAQKAIGQPASALIGNPLDQVWPDLFNEVKGKGQKGVVDSAEKRMYDVSISPVSNWRGLITGRVIVAHDITERTQAEKQIKKSLREKEVLLREIHHRVKNNLQIISSLLSLQSRYIRDTQYTELLRDSQNRIRSMALIHEKLYQSENLADIDFEGYIRTLINELVRTYNADVDRVAMIIDVEDIPLTIDTAIPCGLIINELVSNSLKHAFPDGKGEICVVLRSVHGSIELHIGDNGVGIPEDIDFRMTETLGLRLVTILAEDQLDGDITLDRREGTIFHIRFKKVNSHEKD